MIIPFILLSTLMRQGPSLPLSDLKQAVVFTINEGSGGSAHAMALMEKIPANLMIRSWFKWHEAPPVAQWINQPKQAHQLGILFGGGITCSALYDGENGLSQSQLLDMATRDAEGKLVNAWGQPGIRHGSLSSPAYLDYMFRWCREQIDAGVDSLFMDEREAAIEAKEGFDDHTLNAFRVFLMRDNQNTKAWGLRDSRWKREFDIDLSDSKACPTGSIDSFRYRAYLQAHSLLKDPNVSSNKLAGQWNAFVTWRNDHAWADLQARIRAYAAEKGHNVTICANGLAPGVDLQVLGVWDRWMTKQGRIDLSENQIPVWHGIVESGQELAGKRVPVVLFQDWGFGNPPFPFMAVPLADRITWIRTKGAEIYAAGGFFAFPVYGPEGCDAGANGTLPIISHLASFYQAHKELFLNSEWLGWQGIQTAARDISIAKRWMPADNTLALHVVNRKLLNGEIQTQKLVSLSIPVSAKPVNVQVVSPDFDSRQSIPASLTGGRILVELPKLDAYAIVLLRFSSPPNLDLLRDPLRIVPNAMWSRPARNEFTVSPTGKVTGLGDLNAFLQARLHPELKNSPTFVTDFAHPTQFRVHIRSVASIGARVCISIDGQVKTVMALPDRDGKNDPSAKEYDQTVEYLVPRGPHRVTVDNDGADWAVVDWYEFK